MSRIAASLAQLNATPSAAASSVVTKGTLQSEFSASQERASKLDALIEVRVNSNWILFFIFKMFVIWL
jgi:hypothetical protein